jgi:hypothetical protein
MGYSAKLAQWSNEIRGKGESGQPISPETVEMLYHGVMEGLRLLSQFTSQVIEQSAWKYAKACPEVCVHFVTSGSRHCDFHVIRLTWICFCCLSHP